MHASEQGAERRSSERKTLWNWICMFGVWRVTGVFSLEWSPDGRSARDVATGLTHQGEAEPTAVVVRSRLPSGVHTRSLCRIS